MATNYTTILKLALPVTGELSGTWGDVVNNNITQMVEQAIAGLAPITTWSAASHTLTVADGTTSESRCAILECSGAPGAAATVICPTNSKIYIVKNTVTGGYAVTLKTAAGTGIAVPNGGEMVLYCDGTNVVAGVDKIGLSVITGLTGSLITPVGTTAQRDAAPASGYLRFNSSLTSFEGYNGTAWVTLSSAATYSMTYLAIAGGGGGDYGGGGAGGYLTSTALLTPSTTYTVTVGGGGAVSTNGVNSLISSVVTAIGGGSGESATSGSSGGSGGGGFNTTGGGAGTVGQGNNGGGSASNSGGGGGGAGAVGASGTSDVGGAGGNGSSSSITGSAVTRGGGGGGRSNGFPGGAAGSGGGGAGGGSNNSYVGGAGTANTGGGGGGGNTSGAGGSGVVILSVPTVNYSGITTGSPTVTTNGANTIMQFNSSGSYTA